MKKLRKQLKSYMSVLKNEYKNKNSRNEWLRDNFHVIEKNYNSAMTHSRLINIDSDNSLTLKVCSEFIIRGRLPDDSRIINRILHSSLSTHEIEHIAFFIKFTLIKIAAESVNSDMEVFASTVDSMRKLKETDFSHILYETCETEKILCQDPAGIYRSMDDATKSAYRKAVYTFSLKNGRTEKETAVEALEKAQQEHRHIGFFLHFPSVNRKKSCFLISLEAAIPFIAAVILSVILKAWYLLPLLILPLWECTKFVSSSVISQSVKAQPVMSMDFHEKIPDNEKTVIAVSTILPSAEKAENRLYHLRDLYLSNGGENVYICLLADLKSADTPVAASDRNDIKAMKRVINRLNEKYNNSFILAVRSRRYSVTEKEYTGFERKRGAMASLVKLIKGESHDFIELYGDIPALAGTKHIMALDSDTQMPAGSLSRLVSVAAHPLNTPVISPSKHKVTHGYGIIVPSVTTGIKQSKATHFSSLMSGNAGLAAYSHGTGEKNQLLFGESLFCGKGLIDVNAFHRLLCDRFPEQQILSHDIPEGIIMRCLFTGNISLTDSFPTTVKSYFSRQHRWIRGDLQNISLLTDRRYSSSFTFPGWWWLTDNIRQGLTPAAALTALFLSLLMPSHIAFTTVTVVLLSAFLPDFISCLSGIIHGGISVVSRLYFSSAVPDSLNCLVRGLAKVSMLSREAVNNADALIRAFFRLTVSRRHLLQWTTATESEKDNKVNISPVSLAAGLILIIFGTSLQRFAGIMFLLEIPFSLLTARKKKLRKKSLTAKEKEKLVSYCSPMWQFYEEHCTKENNYLIPDNIQETPVYAVAKRTSPTNIGLMLCAFLAARDLNFTDTPEMYLRISRSLDTVEKLPEYKGNLYNWYDIEKLTVLDPPFISSVDSGNFLCCLTALKEGLREYMNEYPPVVKLIDRINKLTDRCDFGFLYSKKRELFHIGYDTQNKTFTPSYFDLLMSEARMASYYAVAKGCVPIKHWAALGRTLSSDGRYQGSVSWSGTMFEYFMPALFLPNIPDTLGYEAVNFCIHAQKKRVKKLNIPYGISESGYYAFDSQLNYQYKAHGVRSLSLRSTPFDEAVISPYSTFLTLPADPHSAMHNLARLEKLDTVGRYGFCEAVDFSEKRRDNRSFRIVRSYMSHHIGMSFLAAVNCLCDNLMQKRFMNDDFMAGKSDLLNEKIPSDEKVHKAIYDEERKLPDRIKPAKKTYEGISATDTNTTLLSNGEWSVFAADTGASVSVYSNKSLFRCRKDAFMTPDGIFAAIKYNSQTVLPFTDAPVYGNSSSFSVSFTDKSIIYRNSDKSFAVSQTVTVHPSSPCEIRTFRIKNKTKSKKSVSFMIYCEPSIENIRENIAHPAFSSLFMSVKFVKEHNILIFTRKNEDSDKLFVAVGFMSDTSFDFSTDREAILTRDTGMVGIFTNSFRVNSASPDKCIALEISVNIDSFATFSETLFVCAADSEDAVINRFISLRKNRLPSETKCGSKVFCADSVQDIYADKIIGRYLFSQVLPYEAKKVSRINQGNRNDLWALGISGDLPIILVRVQDENNTAISEFVAIHEKLKKCGFPAETVFITDENDEYESKIRKSVAAAVSDENELDRAGGIFILNTKFLTRNRLSALTAAAIAVYPESDVSIQSEKFIMKHPDRAHSLSSTTGFAKDGYIIGTQPCLPWCHVIANRNFGTLISDNSLGYTWALNSRENKLTPWYNDTRRPADGERLVLSTESGKKDIIKGASAFFKGNSGEYYALADRLNIRTRVTVEGESLCKQLQINIINDEYEYRETEISYYIEPVMGDFPQKPLFIKKEVCDNQVIIWNLWNTAFNGCTVLSTDGECTFSFDKASFLSNTAREASNDDCVIITRKIKLPPKSDTCIKFWLTYGNHRNAALKMPEIIPKKTNTNRIIIQTPDNELNELFNNFLPHQITEGRIFARTAFYQCGGAYGFRDQLQDAMAVCITHPELLKIQILRCCAAQFREGDVLHWFHQLYFGRRRIMRGVRTLYSDDLLWLPLAVSEYCIKTGDMKILSTPVPFIDAPVLEEGEHERYGEFTKGNTCAPVYEHCLRAIRHACRFGAHGLPLIKGGDWNDSFNLVGIAGKGESVWLAMFMSYVLRSFVPICIFRNDRKTADMLSQLSIKLQKATNESAWSEDRYLRCFYDDGTPMGKKGNSECEIDLLPQAWSVLSSMPDTNRCSTAVNTACRELTDKKNGIVKLFTPAFTEKSKLTGYVNRYPEGIRENGGQYTHGALWLAKALFRLNDADRGYELLEIMNPAKKDTAVYKTEPYYLAGDVYSAENMAGRGGWSIYSGSAGWYYRIIAEDMAGINMTNGIIKTNPRLPEKLRESRVKIILNNSTYDFELRR